MMGLVICSSRPKSMEFTFSIPVIWRHLIPILCDALERWGIQSTISNTQWQTPPLTKQAKPQIDQVLWLKVPDKTNRLDKKTCLEISLPSSKPEITPRTSLTEYFPTVQQNPNPQLVPNDHYRLTWKKVRNSKDALSSRKNWKEKNRLNSLWNETWKK